jgi:hypothetical protein
VAACDITFIRAWVRGYYGFLVRRVAEEYSGAKDKQIKAEVWNRLTKEAVKFSGADKDTVSALLSRMRKSGEL